MRRSSGAGAHPRRRPHGLVQSPRPIQPGQLGGGQGDELDPERLDSVCVPFALRFAWRERGVSHGDGDDEDMTVALSPGGAIVFRAWLRQRGLDPLVCNS